MIPLYEELTDYLNINEAKIQEEYWKNKSEEEGYLSLNGAKTGALGSNKLIWNKEKCKKEALKYKNRTEFHINSSSAYNSAYKNGWLNNICSHMIGQKNWKDKESCRKEALKYKTRQEYSSGSCSSWDSARRNGWLDEICSHMVVLRKPKGYWSLENSIIEAKKYNKSSELKNNCSRAYKILCKNNLIDKIYSKNK